MGNTYLIHHGIKGQKWGIRRTAAQLGHKVSSSFKKRRETRAAVKAAKKTQKVELTVEQKKEQVLKSRSAAELYKNAPLFSTNELQSAYNRLSLERNIKNLIPKEVTRGEEFIRKMEKVSNVFKTSANTISNASKLYNNVAKVFNAMSDDNDDHLPLINIDDNNNNGGKKGKNKGKKQSSSENGSNNNPSPAQDDNSNKSSSKKNKSNKSSDIPHWEGEVVNNDDVHREEREREAYRSAITDPTRRLETRGFTMR